MKALIFFKRCFALFRRLWPQSETSTGHKQQQFYSEKLNRNVLLDLFLPIGFRDNWSLLLLNDGQDAESLKIKEAHTAFCTEFGVPLLIVAIPTGNRMQEYGTAKQLNDKGLGKMAATYQAFLIEELLPYLTNHFPISTLPEHIGIAGCSLGGLSAIDTAWNNPDSFGISGVFSGALWWRNSPFDPNDPDANRIMHQQVEHGKYRKQRFWFMAGTLDEMDDRNNNGIIDAIDDTLHLMSLLQSKVEHPNLNIAYLQVEGGKHDQETWSKVFPNFLEWAFYRG